MTKRLATIADLTPDARNANQGTARGRSLLEDSLRRYGAGRSILADKHGNLIAGNKTAEVAAELGLPIRTIETDGHELVVVQRTDLDLTEGGAARELAYTDNRSAELSLLWDIEQIQADQAAGLDLAALGFRDDELTALLTSPHGYDGTEQAEPQLASESIIEIYCSRSDAAAFAPTLAEWKARKGVTINIS